MSAKKDPTYLDAKIGDELIVIERRRDFDAEQLRRRKSEETGRSLSCERLFKNVQHTAVVTKVGTKYVYATEQGKYFVELKIAKDTGWAINTRHGVGTGKRAFTPASYEAHQRRQKARETVREVVQKGSGYSWPDDLTTEALEDIARILSNKESRL
ncbi:hypothetical protein KNU78_gp09 [Gordonia phage Sukkupi]|uniref:Uncharacterized protein n=1 Tax=Gordonia phage Sukkupi TaxID=2653747 RepID=A0A5Q2WL80_9CAUD|nr:hypothetical protein KNU78_gp09 [Gordonia phage Sukkupi]QAU07058.1 hypothetical protein SEA_BIPAUNETO_9 [Gordonia phage BiPauneto]QGH79252.1 hypothetical protein SEA_SUKKUPI_9 [Gordonia phage Sukkupi]QGH80725.1 hypothetical protein SEA_YNDEXA_9 [Gordonia phage Yndexa]